MYQLSKKINTGNDNGLKISCGWKRIGCHTHCYSTKLQVNEMWVVLNTDFLMISLETGKGQKAQTSILWWK
jgi:hypothetical protein